MTRFQIEIRDRNVLKTCVFRDLEPTTTTVADVKRMVERDVGEKVEMLRRGERKLKTVGVVSFFAFSFLSLSSVRAREKKRVSL